MSFTEISERMGWSRSTMLSVLFAFIEENDLWDTLNAWATEVYAEAVFECVDCQGTSIGNPHSKDSCRVCGGTGSQKIETK